MGSGWKWLLQSEIVLFGCCSSFALLAQCPAQIWLPYTVVTDEGVTGTDIELIRKVLHDIGSERQLLSLPESWALNDLEGGKVDLLFAASDTEQRAKFAWFSKPYRDETNVVIVHPLVIDRYPELTNNSASSGMTGISLQNDHIPLTLTRKS